MTHSIFDHDDFWKVVNDDVNKAVYRSMGQALVVQAIEENGTMIRLTDIRNEPMGLAPYFGFEKLLVGDTVWVEPVARLENGTISRFLSWVVVGKLHKSRFETRFVEGATITFVGSCDLRGSDSEDGSAWSWQIGSTTGDAIFGNITANGSLTVAGAASVNALTVAGAASVGALTATSSNVYVPFMDSQTSSDDGATSSTTIWSNAMSFTVSLPVGTWSVWVVGFIDVLHSASGRAHIRVEIDGTFGGENSPSAPATSPQYRTIKADHARTSVAGNRSITVRAQFKSTDTGTTTPNNPLIMGIARRTS